MHIVSFSCMLSPYYMDYCAKVKTHCYFKYFYCPLGLSLVN